jgi:hypothetical protein
MLREVDLSKLMKSYAIEARIGFTGGLLLDSFNFR